jgi:arylformamidase
MYVARCTLRIAPSLLVGMSVMLTLTVGAAPIHAQQQGTVRRAIERPRDGRQGREVEGLDDGAAELGRITLPPNVRVERDVSYGVDAKQRFDVYLPARASRAPVMILVHGGGWRIGDKSSRAVVQNKVARWTRAGIIVISVNYRLLPAANPIVQAEDVARAIAVAQQRLPEWGGDPGRIVLVGHSAGAHLVALIAGDQSFITHQGGQPSIVGSIILDSAVLDVEQTMLAPHLPLYDAAFGTSRRFWRFASPWRQLGAGASPLLIVCSTNRRDSCPAAQKLVRRVHRQRGALPPDARLLVRPRAPQLTLRTDLVELELLDRPRRRILRRRRLRDAHELRARRRERDDGEGTAALPFRHRIAPRRAVHRELHAVAARVRHRPRGRAGRTARRHR